MTRSALLPPAYDFELVAARLGQAGMTLLALQVRGLKPAGYGSSMPLPIDTVVDDTRVPPPPAKQISEMDQALSWILLLPAEQVALRRLVHARAMTSPRTGKPLFSWRTLGRFMRCHHQTAKTQWIGAIETIVLRLNSPGLCAAAPCIGTRQAMIAALERAADQAALGPVDGIRHVERV